MATIGKFTVPVNYDDVRWETVNRDRYLFVTHDLRSEDFPIRGQGTAEVVMTLVVFENESDPQQVLDEIKRLGLRVPDRAEAESFHEKHPAERTKYPIIALSSSVTGHGGQHVACIYAHWGDLGLYRHLLGHCWGQDCRFLAIHPQSL